MANKKKYTPIPICKNHLCDTCTRYRAQPDCAGYYYDACFNNTEHCRYVRQRSIHVDYGKTINNLEQMRKYNDDLRKYRIPF